MMAKTPTSISLDADVRERVMPILNEMGLDLSTAVGIFLRQTIRERRIPFEIRLDTPNAVTIAAMEAAEKDEDMYGPFDSVAELMEDLNADDSI